MEKIDSAPNRTRMPPPLPCLIGAIVGGVLHWLAPLPILQYTPSMIIGLLLVALVVYLSIKVHFDYKRHSTSPDPADESVAIVDTGLYKYSRNPIYVTVGILQVAIGFLANSWWIILLTLPALIAINNIVILSEEAYLEHKFNDEYREYKARVRRWL